MSYSVSQRNITAGTNTIPFSAFSLVPRMTITVTEIPERYISSYSGLAIYLMLPGISERGRAVAYGGQYFRYIEPPSVTVAFWDWRLGHIEWPFNTPGAFDVWLDFRAFDGDQESREGSYFIPSRDITTGNTTIPFSELTVAPNSFIENLDPRNEARLGRSCARAHLPMMR